MFRKGSITEGYHKYVRFIKKKKGRRRDLLWGGQPEGDGQRTATEHSGEDTRMKYHDVYV